MFFSPKSFADDENYMTTGIHRAIVQEQDWLNTSRPLVADDLKGRIILLDFWTFCCINCIHVVPELHALEQKFGDKLTVIGVHSAKFANEKDRENIRSAILRYDIEHPVVNDAAFKTWQSFAVRAWPTLILINPQGKIEEMFSGEGNGPALEQKIARLIRDNPQLTATKLPMALEKNKEAPTTLKFPGKIAHADSFNGKPAFFISDSGHHRIVVTNESGKILASAGTGMQGAHDGDFSIAQFNSPQGLLYDDANNLLYVADTGNHKLRVIDFAKKEVRTLAGTGERGNYRISDNSPALKTALASPWDLAFYPTRDEIAIANAGSHQLLSYNIKAKSLRILAGNGRESIDDGKYPQNSLSQPSGLSVLGDKLYFVDSETSSLRVLQNGEVKTLIGTGLFDFGLKDGKQGQALLQHSLGLYAEDGGVYIADSYNHAVRFYDFKTGEVSTYAGNGTRGDAVGELKDTRLNEPNDILRVGNKLYVADTNNNRLIALDTKQKTSAVLDIANPVAKTGPALPNLFATTPATVMEQKSIPVKLDLAPGWKINHDAPSQLDLVTAQGDVLQSYDKDALRLSTLALPPLEKGKGYKLQGTLYFCEDKANSLCLIRSFDQKIETQTTAAQNEIRFDLKMKLDQ
jgi:thiol-disulfide isomerase/thioredoxin